ncbi:N-acylethanolamine-hydrolyzing acid amidase-like [Gigantopelta aegis]|uniref:N-acylethanolamine-hydrolyzing acid amidase-like n=1 Tax=Gigantopelta aegis TaxID=1735272 RepID=UPI001B8881D4|nr:N-acylethanolamine-hydrolyzing acid amidase-like [Gigantopelta aegis]
MKSVQIVISLALFGLAVGLAVKPTGDEPTQVPFYTVDLDQPEEKRWDHIMKEYAEDVKYVHEIMSDIFPEDLIPLVEQIAANYDNDIEDPYANEMRGIAKTMNVSLGDVVFLNIIYDLSAFGRDDSRFGKACTSIVSEDVNGLIWHARNLDYDFADILRNVTIGVHFQTGGSTTYSSITFAGYVGVLTGQKPHGYTITVNERDQGNWWMNILIALMDPNAVPIGFLTRDTLTYFTDFAGAVENLAQTDTIAPVYFVLGGVNKRQGVVITKSRIESDDLWYLGAEKNYSNWFLVETNYDHWEPAPSSDDRRDPAIKAMKDMGKQKISVQNLLSVLSTPLVKNNSTVYSIVMSASQPSLLKAWVRYPS